MTVTLEITARHYLWECINDAGDVVASQEQVRTRFGSEMTSPYDMEEQLDAAGFPDLAYKFGFGYPDPLEIMCSLEMIDGTSPEAEEVPA